MSIVNLIWIRWHNLIADILNTNNPNMSDEINYLESRKITVAVMQHIVFDEWIPLLLGEKLSPYSGYNSRIDPQITHEFDAIAFPYIYSLVDSFVFKLSRQCSHNFSYSLIRLCNSYDNTEDYLMGGAADRILAGMLLQSAKNDDRFIVEDIVKYAQGTSLDASRIDLIALLLQQTRDFHLSDYLYVRSQLGLDSADYFSFKQLARRLWPVSISQDRVRLIIQQQKTFFH